MANLTDGKIGQTVRSLREEKGISRERLAQLAKTSTSTIARIELNGHTPTLVTMYGIAKALDTTLDGLVEHEEAA